MAPGLGRPVDETRPAERRGILDERPQQGDLDRLGLKGSTSTTPPDAAGTGITAGPGPEGDSARAKSTCRRWRRAGGHAGLVPAAPGHGGLDGVQWVATPPDHDAGQGPRSESRPSWRSRAGASQPGIDLVRVILADLSSHAGTDRPRERIAIRFTSTTPTPRPSASWWAEHRGQTRAANGRLERLAAGEARPHLAGPPVDDQRPAGDPRAHGGSVPSSQVGGRDCGELWRLTATIAADRPRQTTGAEANGARDLRAGIDVRWWTILDLNQ